MDLENEARELVFVRSDEAGRCFARLGVGGNVDEGVQHLLNPEVVDGTSKEHRSQLALEVGRRVPRVVHPFDQLDILAQRLGVFADEVVQGAVLQRVNRHHVLGHLGFVGLEQPQALVVQVVDPLERMALRNGPGEGTDLDVELGFHLVQQVGGVMASRSISLMKTITGVLRMRQTSMRRSVWGSTPSRSQ